jgi:hypothetical protein
VGGSSAAGKVRQVPDYLMCRVVAKVAIRPWVARAFT